MIDMLKSSARGRDGHRLELLEAVDLDTVSGAVPLPVSRAGSGRGGRGRPALGLRGPSRSPADPLPPEAGPELLPDEIQQSVASFLRSQVKHAPAPIQYPKTHDSLEATLALGHRLIETYGTGAECRVAGHGIGDHPTPPTLPGLELTGVMDRIESDGQGGLRVVELKTASKRLSQAEVDASDR